MRSRGYDFPSICYWCRSSAESLDHLSPNCSLARKIWNIGYSAHVRRIVPLLVTWFLWKARNGAKHNGKRPHSAWIIFQIQLHLKRSFETIFLEREICFGASNCISRKNRKLFKLIWGRLVLEQLSGTVVGNLLQLFEIVLVNNFHDRVCMGFRMRKTTGLEMSKGVWVREIGADLIEFSEQHGIKNQVIGVGLQ